MEPLDPKAELMRLVNSVLEAAVKDSADRSRNGDPPYYLPLAIDALSTAITLALAAERRRALEEMAKICDERAEQISRHEIPDWSMVAGCQICASALRKWMDGKTA